MWTRSGNEGIQKDVTKIVVTGGAGFIGSNVTDALLARGDEVWVVDNMSTGRAEFVNPSAHNVLDLDIADPREKSRLGEVLAGTDTVYHLAANADVRFGMNDTMRDINQNVIATVNLAEVADAAGVKHIVFSSTGAVYGDSVEHPTPENTHFPVQTSLYGMSKVAAEGILSSFAANGHFSATSFRFVSVLGQRYMHGHVIDFVRQLVRNPQTLTVLGDGYQRKSYMHVNDCVRALLTLRASSDYEVFNLGAPDYCTVRDSVAWITERMSLTPELVFTGGDRGWVGDNPFTWLDVDLAGSHGWVAGISIRQAVEMTVDWLLANQWALNVQDVRS